MKVDFLRILMSDRKLCLCAFDSVEFELSQSSDPSQ